MDIEVKQLSVTFLSPMGAARVLRDADLLFPGGKITALVGESGSGKSILGTAMMRLLPENARMTGSILYDGKDLLRLSEKEMNEIRGDRIGWIAQDPISAMNPLMRVGRQATEVLRKRLGWGKEKSRESVLAQMKKYGLVDPIRVCGFYPHQLSGGMAQRVMAAMMTLPSPECSSRMNRRRVWILLSGNRWQICFFRSRRQEVGCSSSRTISHWQNGSPIVWWCSTPGKSSSRGAQRIFSRIHTTLIHGDFSPRRRPAAFIPSPEIRRIFPVSRRAAFFGVGVRSAKKAVRRGRR